MQDLEFEFDTLGNLKERTDHRHDWEETVTYDALNRIIFAERTVLNTPSVLDSVGVTYDALGNIVSKTTLAGVSIYGYGDGSNGESPHAVLTMGGRTFTYDANGNQLTGV